MGFGPGGLGDIAGRAIGQVMSQSTRAGRSWSRTCRARAASNAALALTRAAPDGHTLLWVSSQNAIAPSMFKSLPYDWSRDFAPVGPMATFDFVLFVHKDSPLKTVRDVIDAAKANPDKFNFGSIAVGTRAEPVDAEFRRDGRPQGADRAVPDHRRGGHRADLRQHPGGVRDHSGRHRPDQCRRDARDRAFRRNRRVPFLPDVPTIAESGVPGYWTYSWNGIVAPAKTPPNIVLRLNKEINSAIATPGNPEAFPRTDHGTAHRHAGGSAENL